MTQVKHTNEPIDVRDENAASVLSGIGDAEISGEIVGEYLEPMGFRRLAAAWNACEGIPTEALEAGVVKDMLGALLECRKELEEWDAELSGEGYNNPTLNNIISRATGEKP